MSEENNNGNNENDVVISSKEIEDVEREVLAKERKENESKEKQIEEKIRKKIQDEQNLAKLKEEKERLEKVVASQVKEREELEKKQKEFEEKMAATKSIVRVNSPFQDNKNNNPSGKKISNLTRQELQEIDKASEEVFLKEHGLTRKQWMN